MLESEIVGSSRSRSRVPWSFHVLIGRSSSEFHLKEIQIHDRPFTSSPTSRNQISGWRGQRGDLKCRLREGVCRAEAFDSHSLLGQEFRQCLEFVLAIKKFVKNQDRAHTEKR